LEWNKEKGVSSSGIRNDDSGRENAEKQRAAYLAEYRVGKKNNTGKKSQVCETEEGRKVARVR